MIRLFRRLFIMIFLTAVFPLFNTVVAEESEEFKEALCFVSRYPEYKKIWGEIAKGLNDDQIKNWVEAFSDDSSISNFLCDHKDHEEFPTLLFHKISELMKKTPSFETEQVREGTACNDLDVSKNFSPDGKYMVAISVSNPKQVNIRKKDEKTVSLVKEKCILHHGVINSVSFSPDGQYIVTASDDKTAMIWGLGTSGDWINKGRIDHNDLVHSATFSYDGQHIVTASADKTAKIYGLNDVGRWEEKACISHDHEVIMARLSVDGRYVVIMSKDEMNKIYRLRMRRYPTY